MPYLGIDPGDLTGVALVSDSGSILDFDNYTFDGLTSYLTTLSVTFGQTHVKLHRIVMENYVVYGHKAQQHTGSKVQAAQVIGVVKYWAKQHNIPVTLQMANILPIAYRQSGITPTGAHKYEHWKDAANHVLYYMYQNKLAKTKVERDLERQNGK